MIVTAARRARLEVCAPLIFWGQRGDSGRVSLPLYLVHLVSQLNTFCILVCVCVCVCVCLSVFGWVVVCFCVFFVVVYFFVHGILNTLSRKRV